jgi:hypothetical protein
LLGDKVFHVRCDYNSANLALEDLGWEKVTFSLFRMK